MVSSRRPLALPALDVDPVHVRVSLKVFLRGAPKERRYLIDCGLVLGAAALFQWWPLAIAGAVLLLPFWRRYRKVQRLMWDGSAHAAKVVSLDPPLAAYYGDLTKGSLEPQPIVVIHQFDRKFQTEAMQTGDRVAVVAKPVGGDLRMFDHLETRLVGSVTDDRKTIRRVIDSVPEWAWDELDEALFDLPHPFEKGVHSAVRSKAGTR